MADEIHAPPRGYKSNVWNYFGVQHKKGGSVLDLDFAVCKICHITIRLGDRFGNKAELWTHLTENHLMEVEPRHNAIIDRNGDSQPSTFYPAPEPPMEDTPGTQSLRTYSRTSSSTSASYPGPHSSPAFAAPPPYPAFSPSSFPTLSSSLSSSIAPPTLASPSSLPPPYPLPASSSLPPPYPLPPSSSLLPPYPALVPSTLPAPSSLSVPSSPPPPPSPAQRGGALQEQLVQCVSWSLEEQRASRVALGAVGRSLSSLAQSVQDVVESQQDFVHDSLRLQREMVDMLRDFSADALTLLRDKVNGRLPP